MSNNVISNIVEFNRRILGIQQRSVDMLSENESSITFKCLIEEATEFKEGIEEKDVIKSIDSLIDSIYFAIGAMYKFGLTPDQIEECINAVHSCNMEKKLGVNERRSTGAADAIKPEDWIGPEERIANIIGDSNKWPL